MRAAPLGARFFADDLDRVVEQARIASRVSHAHPEALAGGIAVAVASALAAQQRKPSVSLQSFLGEVASRLPEPTSTRGLLRRAEQMEEASPRQAVTALDNGSHIPAQDT